jgi:uncharacterized protein DUF4149
MFRWLFQFLLILALSLWVGSIVFFSLVVAPGVFSTLDRPDAGKLLAHLFPKYYLVGTLCGSAALALLFLLFLFDSGSRGLRLFQGLLVTLMLAGNLYAGLVLEERIHLLRDRRVDAPTQALREEAEKGFDRLHHRSVRVNAGVLGVGIVVAGTLALRKKPA